MSKRRRPMPVSIAQLDAEELSTGELIVRRDEPAETRWLIFGVGSSEPRFLGTRFNVGAAAIDALASINDVHMREVGSLWFGNAIRGNAILSFAKPNIMPEMIEDALKLLKAADSYDPGHIIMMYGDHAFPPGEIKIKNKGGQAGNKVVDGFLDYFGGRDRKEVVRVRIGLGPHTESNRGGVVEFSEEQFPKIMRGLHVAAEAVHCLIDSGHIAASNFSSLANRGKILV